ncbi:MAG: IS21 family transposase [Thermoleophilia bacterium]
MRKIKEILRLKALGLTNRQIAASVNAAHSTVNEYIRRAEVVGISWQSASQVDEAELQARLFKKPQLPARRAEPDFAYINQELKRKGVTLKLLWQEYLDQNPDGYRYTQFCHLYKNFAGHGKPVMRQSYKAGEKMFVDYAGQTMPITNPVTGEVSEAQIFVAALGASNFTFAEATESQDLFSWIGSHTRAFSFFGGVPGVLVPDNLRAGVSKSCRYEPDLNPTYAEMAAHYGIAVIPARVRKPRDKAKVEAAVLIVERQILAPLRNHTFFSTAELNRAMRPLLEKLNQKPFAKLEGSRALVFETLEKPALGSLPVRPYEFAIFKKARVNIDYHIEVERHFYSVPYQLVGRQLDVRLTAGVVEVLGNGKRIASHRRSHVRGGYSTKDEHRPPAHRHYQKWPPERLIAWAGKTGPETAGLAQAILQRKKHPEQGYRSCQGLIRLTNKYPAERMEAACRLALVAGAHSYKSVKSILEKNLDQLSGETETGQKQLPINLHDNVRGKDYYH